MDNNYIKTKYIQYTGSTKGYFNTDYIAKANTVVKLRISIDEIGMWRCIFGGRSGSQNGMSLYTHGNKYEFSYFVGGYVNDDMAPLPSPLDTIVDVECALGYLKIGETTYNTNQQTFAASTNPIWIFACQNDFSFHGKIYDFAIYEDNTLIKHYIPVKRISDDYACFYEAVSDTIVNPTQGTFISGPIAHILSLDNNVLKFYSSGGTDQFTVTCQTGWTCTTPTHFWLSTNNGVSGDTTVTVRAPYYTGDTAVTESVTITDNDGYTDVLTLKQKKYVSGVDSSLFVSADNIDTLYIGSEQIELIYCGEEIVYQLTSEPVELAEFVTMNFVTTGANQTVTIGQNVTGFTAMIIDDDGVYRISMGTVTFENAGSHKVSFLNFGTSIPNNAFVGSEATAITISSAVTSCGNYAFANTPNLEYIYGGGSDDNYFILNGVLYGGAEAGIGQTANVPYGVTKIANGAFYGNATIETINYPTTLVEMGYHVFSTGNVITEINYRGNFIYYDIPFLQGGDINTPSYCIGPSISSEWGEKGWTINRKVEFDGVTGTTSSTTGHTGSSPSTTIYWEVITVNVSDIAINADDERIMVAEGIQTTYIHTDVNPTTYKYWSIYMDSNNNLIIKNADYNIGHEDINGSETIIPDGTTEDYGWSNLLGTEGKFTYKYVKNPTSSSSDSRTTTIYLI